MRILKLNTTKLWKVSISGYTDAVDDDGNFTGEELPIYTSPIEVELSLYPIVGNVQRDLIGIVTDEEYVAIAIDIQLEREDLLFKTEPSGDYDTTYDYIVKNILLSLNSNQFTLKMRS